MAWVFLLEKFLGEYHYHVTRRFEIVPQWRIKMTIKTNEWDKIGHPMVRLDDFGCYNSGIAISTDDDTVLCNKSVLQTARE